MILAEATMFTRKRVVVAASGFGVLLLLLPLIWWQFFGPHRFEDLSLGAEPEDVIEVEAQPGDAELRRFALLAGREDLAAAADGFEAQTIELPPLNISATTRVTLLFSVGSDGMTRRDANRLRVADVGDRGGDRLTDSIMLLVSDAPTHKAALVSIPRDLWMSRRGHRINETFVRFGIQAFVDDVSAMSGLPIHHVVQVNFTAFADLVDAVDGVALDVPVPLADLYSVLYVPQAGCWRFDGADALAYARSRHTLTTTDGSRWRGASTASDIGRMARQQALVGAAWDQVRGPGFVGRIPDLISIANGLTIDRGLGIDDMVAIARSFQDVAAGRVERHIVPVVDRRIGAAQVMALDWRRAPAYYERLRNWPPGGPIDTGSGGSAGASPEGGDASPAQESQPTAEPSRSPSPSESGGLTAPLGGLTGSDEEASESPSPSASPSSSSSSEPESAGSESTMAATRPDNPSPGSRTPSAPGGCSRSSAWELPDNPLDYLAAIDNRDPVPPYTPHRRGQDASEPADDGDRSSDPSDDPSDEPTDDPSDEPTDDPSDDPSAEATTQPTDEPTDEGSPEPSSSGSPAPSDPDHGGAEDGGP